MTRQLRYYVLAVAILVVGALALGVPAASLLLPGFVVACLLLLIFVFWSMRGGHGGDGRWHGDHRDRHSRPGQ